MRSLRSAIRSALRLVVPALVLLVAPTACEQNPSGLATLGRGSPPMPALDVAPPESDSPILIGAANLGSCGILPYANRDDQVALLLDAYPTATVFSAGNNVFVEGLMSEYQDCYGPSWGRHKARHRPAPGDNDYGNDLPGARGTADDYFAYFGAAAGESPKGYYSYDLGSWHVVVLNATNNKYVSYNVGSPQHAWLQADLAKNTKPCIVGYWEEPRFASSTSAASATASVKAVWDVLYEYGAEVVLNGNKSHYERLKPMNPDGAAVADGIREFIVGTGGGKFIGVPTGATQVHPNSEVIGNEYGVLKLVLGSRSYAWEFLSIAGSTKNFRDAGSAECTDNRATPAVELTSSANPAPFGQPVTFTAAVTAGGAPVTLGEVTFIDGGSCEAPGAVLAGPTALDAAGRASYTTAELTTAASPHAVGACFGGNGKHTPAGATVDQTITNNPPVAGDDSYGDGREDTPLVVAAPGVLANDSDFEGSALAAAVVSGPTRGTLMLDTDGSFTYTPNANYNGADGFTYQAIDQFGASSGVATVSITVGAVNDAPQFIKGADQTVVRDAPAQSVANWATAITAGPANESGQSVGFVVTNSAPALFSAKPAVSPTGTLTYTPAAGASGTATVTVTLKDDGGTVNGGSDTSPSQTFTITITAPTSTRITVTLDMVPGSSTNTIGYSTTSDVTFAILSSATFDATLIDPATVTLGNEQGTDTPLIKNTSGTWKFVLTDVNGDFRPDFYGYVNKAAMKTNGDLTLSTTSLTALAGLKAPRTELVRGTGMVKVVP